jgi:hypothetical protein
MPTPPEVAPTVDKTQYDVEAAWKWLVAANPPPIQLDRYYFSDEDVLWSVGEDHPQGLAPFKKENQTDG